MKIKQTERGFEFIEFIDYFGHVSSLQKSSLANEEAIWFGVNDADPKILASKIMKDGRGWVKYPIHKDVNFNTRMHLSRKQVKDLLPYLQKFVDTGNLT
jgi:hypothetical protein